MEYKVINKTKHALLPTTQAWNLNILDLLESLPTGLFEERLDQSSQTDAEKNDAFNAEILRLAKEKFPIERRTNLMLVVGGVKYIGYSIDDGDKLENELYILKTPHNKTVAVDIYMREYDYPISFFADDIEGFSIGETTYVKREY